MTDEPKSPRKPRKAAKAKKAVKKAAKPKAAPSKAPKPKEAAKPLPVSADPKKNPVGRPSDYTPELGETLCLLVAEGCSVREISEIPGMPAKTTFFRWLASNPEFRDHYARAKELAAEAMADELLEIADDASNDYMVRTGKDGAESWVLNGEHVQRSRLRIDTRKWIMSKLLPKKYGDRLAVEDVSVPLDPVERTKRVMALLEAARTRRDREASRLDNVDGASGAADTGA